jgi:uncharacterized protein (DUF427 family)
MSDRGTPVFESVWDYPRPPRLEPVNTRLRVVFAGHVIADTTRGYRVLETSHPPVYYLPPDDIVDGCLVRAIGHTWCEFKGTACYWTLELNGQRSKRAAWSYPEPGAAFRPIAGYVAFYPSRMDACWVNDEQVTAQKGDFYGGWITSNVRGPFKGAPGTLGW